MWTRGKSENFMLLLVTRKKNDQSCCEKGHSEHKITVVVLFMLRQELPLSIEPQLHTESIV